MLRNSSKSSETAKVISTVTLRPLSPVNDYIVSGASSSSTSFGLLSGRSPRKVVCRICPSLVHSVLDQTSRILLAPFQRLPDDFVFARAREIPQEPLARSLVDKRGKRRSLRAPPDVQLDRKWTMVDALLKRWRVPHFSLIDTRYTSRLLAVALRAAAPRFGQMPWN
jgi:hypothetical protein